MRRAVVKARRQSDLSSGWPVLACLGRGKVVTRGGRACARVALPVTTASGNHPPHLGLPLSIDVFGPRSPMQVA